MAKKVELYDLIFINCGHLDQNKNDKKENYPCVCAQVRYAHNK